MPIKIRRPVTPRPEEEPPLLIVPAPADGGRADDKEGPEPPFRIGPQGGAGPAISMAFA